MANDDDEELPTTDFSNLICAPDDGLQPEIQNAFDYGTVIPSPITTPLDAIPPVSCINVPSDNNDVNTPLTSRVADRIDPAGRVPIRITQPHFRNVGNMVQCKPNLVAIDGAPAHNWTQFTESRRSFPTQVTIMQRILLDSASTSAVMVDLPNAFLYLRPKTSFIKNRSSVDPPDFHQG